MIPRDTHPDTHAAEIAAYRAMTPEQRLERAVELAEVERGQIRADIRLRHPDYTDAQVKKALVAVLYGEDLASKVWPDVDLPQGI